MKQQRDFKQIKEKFLEEVAKGKMNIVDLAKKHGISKPCAYTWVRKASKISNKLPEPTNDLPVIKEPSYLDRVILEAVLSRKEELNKELQALSEQRNSIMKIIDSLLIDSLNEFIAKQ